MLAKAVENGEIPVSAAAKLVELAEPVQKRVVEKIQREQASAVTEALRQVRHDDRPAVALTPGKYRSR